MYPFRSTGQESRQVCGELRVTGAARSLTSSGQKIPYSLRFRRGSPWASARLRTCFRSHWRRPVCARLSGRAQVVRNRLRSRVVARDLLDRIIREIRERMDESRGAYEESRRLQAALAALGSGADSKQRAALPKPQKRRPPRRASRAPRGENLRGIRAAIEERPGASAGEVASATGIARPTVATTLGKLVRDGELERCELPGGRVGFRSSRPHDAPDGAAPSADTAAGARPPSDV